MSRPLSCTTLLLSLATVGVFAQVPPARPADLQAAVDSVLDARVATDAFSGVVRVASNVRTVHQRAAGWADRAVGTLMTLDYDPPAATEVAPFAWSLLAGPHQDSLRAEVETLHAEMVAAYRREPASVAGYYTDDASILGGGGRWMGREAIDQYWSRGPGGADWSLDVLEVGGNRQAPWVRGRSTLVSRSGRRMVTDYVGILKRGPDGILRFYIDIFVAGAANR